MEQIVEPGPSATWQAALAEGRILLQRDPASGQVLFPPRPLASAAAEWVEASGDGTIYSVTTIARKPPAADHHVALVDLAEGVRMMGALDLPAGMAPAIGMAVIARIEEHEGGHRITFRPA
ncbi:MAG: hypothetical protein RIQ46_494 [Pseudomonadota bacterium]